MLALLKLTLGSFLGPYRTDENQKNVEAVFSDTKRIMLRSFSVPNFCKFIPPASPKAGIIRPDSMCVRRSASQDPHLELCVAVPFVTWAIMEAVFMISFMFIVFSFF